MSDRDQKLPSSDDGRSNDQPGDSELNADQQNLETRSHDAESSAVGEQIGPYRILEPLGEGGMVTKHDGKPVSDFAGAG